MTCEVDNRADTMRQRGDCMMRLENPEFSMTSKTDLKKWELLRKKILGFNW